MAEKVDIVLQNVCKTVGEGPHWDADSQTLLFVDILVGGVHRWNPATGTHVSFNLDGNVGFITPTTKGDYIIGFNRQLARLNWKDRSVAPLHEVEPGTNNRFNDGKADSSGRIWAGTMSRATTVKTPVMEVSSLYSLERDGALRSHVPRVTISNGLAWSADNSRMFYIDTIPRELYVFDYDVATGTPTNKRVAVTFTEAEGYPDGMCIDADDKLWVAMYSGGCIIQLDPATGQRLRAVKIPGAPGTTSCCWGGPELDELYVTCLVHPKKEEQEPNAGSVFRVTGLGVKGVPMYNYDG